MRGLMLIGLARDSGEPRLTTDEVTDALGGHGLDISREYVQASLVANDGGTVKWEAMGDVKWHITPSGLDRLAALGG
jgi:hypothetical protein